MARREIFGRFEGKQKEPGEATPTKIGLHVFHINLYLHEYFEPILFLIPWTFEDSYFNTCNCFCACKEPY